MWSVFRHSVSETPTKVSGFQTTQNGLKSKLFGNRVCEIHTSSDFRHLLCTVCNQKFQASIKSAMLQSFKIDDETSGICLFPSSFQWREHKNCERYLKYRASFSTCFKNIECLGDWKVIISNYIDKRRLKEAQINVFEGLTLLVAYPWQRLLDWGKNGIK